MGTRLVRLRRIWWFGLMALLRLRLRRGGNAAGVVLCRRAPGILSWRSDVWVIARAGYLRRSAAAGALVSIHTEAPDRSVRRFVQFRVLLPGVGDGNGGAGDGGSVVRIAVNGLYRTELVRHRGPSRTFDALELATLEWVTGTTINGSIAHAGIFHRPTTEPPTIEISYWR